MQWSHEPQRRNLRGKAYYVSRGTTVRRNGVCRTSAACLAIGAHRRGLGATPFASLVPPAAPADGNVPQGAAAGPVTPTGLAEVAGLSEAVVVEIAKFCVGGLAAWAF